MKNDFNPRALKILEKAKALSEKNRISTMGTEYLIISMYEIEDSLCHFLLDEYDVTKEEIEAKTQSLIIMRKKKESLNSSMENLIKQAKLLAGDDSIGEEHLFMAILMNRNTIACSILESLGLSIDDLILDVKEIYDFKKEPEYMDFAKNITQLAKNNELAQFVRRSEYLEKMSVILNRKYKNNPLLIGNAGVGKTALVEGYALDLLKTNPEQEVISLNIAAMLSGTKYRGDFEQRFDEFMKKICQKKNIIVFIDEIHTIMGTGTTEGNLDVANMLKPFIARNDIKLIGATTIEEYHKTIERDKALCRRFQTIFVQEPSIEETVRILKGIKENYETFHQVKIGDNELIYLIEESNRRIPNRYRPDKCIDILDDVMSRNRLKNYTEVSFMDIDNSINLYIGYELSFDKSDLNYPIIAKYAWLEEANLLDYPVLLKIKYVGDKYGASNLLLDIKRSFKISEEMILELDLMSYKESFMLSSLIGAPPGYVGHNEEGILSKFILKYPLSVIFIKNFEFGHYSIQKFFMNIMEKGLFFDQRGEKVSCKNSIFIIQSKSNDNYLGFIESKKNNDNEFFDEIINSTQSFHNTFNEKYTNALSKYQIEASFEFDIDDSNRKIVDDYFFDVVKRKRKGKILLALENGNLIEK